MDAILESTSLSRMKSSLNDIPASLAQIYASIIERMGNKDHSGVKALIWVSYAMRPLRPRELQHALSSWYLKPEGPVLDDDNLLGVEEIIDACGDFISVPKDKDVVVFVHYTAKEYIERALPTLHPRATNTIVESCLRYLSLAEFATGPCPETEIRDRMLKYPLATYAAPYWVNHVKKDEEQLSDELINEIVTFLTHKRLFPSWIQVLEYVEAQKTTEDGDREVEAPTTSTMLTRNMWRSDVARVLGLGERVIDAIDSIKDYGV